MNCSVCECELTPEEIEANEGLDEPLCEQCEDDGELGDDDEDEDEDAEDFDDDYEGDEDEDEDEDEIE